MKQLKGKISVIIPAYNEAVRIASSIEEIVKTFNRFSCAWELIVIDDGSCDATYEISREIAERYPSQIQVKKNPVNLGKGRALKKALHYVSGEYTLWLDADMELHPLQAQTLMDIMRLDNADIVIGSKLHPNSIVDYPFLRKIVSLGYYLLVKFLFGLPCHDTQTGIKLFRTEVLRKVFPRILVKKFAFDLEVLVNAHHLGYKIAEAPVRIERRRWQSRIGMRTIFTTAWDTLAVWYRMYILRYYDRIHYHRRKNLAREFRKMRQGLSGA
ncbi:MAG: glycosyltransferase [Candidatus Omnitrophica bacterium]|nr:glycosyltransferase [Candidatus Omnitrophota bacterium]